MFCHRPPLIIKLTPLTLYPRNNYLVNDNDISVLILLNSQQNIDVSGINNDDTDDSDWSSESKKEESDQEQQVEKLVLHPLGTHNSSELDASNETPPNASSLVEESPQKNEDVVEAEIKVKRVAPYASASNHYLTAGAQTKGACFTFPGGQQPVTDYEERVHTNHIKNRPHVLIAGESCYQPEVKQKQSTSCVQCSDVDMPPLLKPNIIIPKSNSE